MPQPIAVQLYTLRKEAAADLGAVIERLGRIGYRGVETAGLYGLPADELRRRFDGAGLEVAAAHAPLPSGPDANKTLDEVQALGSPALIVAAIAPDRFQSADAVKGAAEDLNAAVNAVAARGLTLGYHNHYWEFATLEGGARAYDLFTSLLDERICLEVDIYWAQTGGVDPSALVAALGSRVAYLHVKDGPCTTQEPMVAVGQGSVDIAGVLAAAPEARWHIVELDRCATDMFEAVEASYAHLVGRGLSAGRA